MKCTGLVMAILVSLAPGCGGGDSPGADGGGDGDGDGGGGGPDADTGTWTTLIERDWSLPANVEDYRCMRVTVPDDLYVSAFRTLGADGEHHTVLSIDNSGGADGPFDCDVGTLADDMLFASGIGTSTYAFPPDVAIRIPAGTKVLLNLHLYSAEVAIDGHSGIQVQTVDPAGVTEAEFIFGGTFNVYLPAGQETTLEGECVFDQQPTVVALWPHQHRLGTHHKVTYQASGSSTETALHDAAYSFEEQLFYEIEPLVVDQGDSIHTYCTWFNDTGGAVYIGESSDSEMCFTGFYRYPKFATDKFCAEGFNPGF